MKDSTVVPFKFGTILKDEQAALKLLDDEEQFKKLLLKFSARAEWGLKVYGDTHAFMQHVAQSNPRFKDLEEQRASLSRGTGYLLGKKVEEELRNSTLPGLLQSLAPFFRS